MLVKIINHLEESLFKKLIFRKLIWLYFELLAHYLCELVNKKLVALKLDILISLNSLILSSIEQIEGRDCVGVQPEDDRKC